MTPPTHTPGPWTCEGGLVVGLDSQRPGDVSYDIFDAEDCPHPDYDEEWQANARLIAAAPDMLEALQDVVNGLGCQPGYVNAWGLQKARAALSKALGEDG